MLIRLTGPVVSAGYFGERWVELASHYGCNVVPLRYEWGQVPSPDDLEGALRSHPDAKSVFLVHSQTSTGVVLDLERFATVTKAAGALLIVDAVSSFAAVPIRVDAWGVDVLISSSDKALMTPPGIAFLVLSPAALDAAQRTQRPRLYLDWERNLATQMGEEPETWFSPLFHSCLVSKPHWTESGAKASRTYTRGMWRSHGTVGLLSRRGGWSSSHRMTTPLRRLLPCGCRTASARRRSFR